MLDIPESVAASPRRLTQAVFQASDMLGLYNAELARVLGLMCGDIGRLSSGGETLAPGTEAWQRALEFLDLYRSLYRCCDGDGAAMCHWLRARHAEIGETPLLAIVDQGRLTAVVELLRKPAAERMHPNK